MATLSLLGLYNHDESLLNGLIENLPNKFGIPSGYEDSYYTDVTIDPQTVIENLLVECAEFEILYSDFDALKRIITIWSAKEKPVWQKMFNTICYKYNPIWNKDGKTTWTEQQTTSGTKTEMEKGTKTTREDGSITDDYTSTSTTTNTTTGAGTNTRAGNDETTGKVSAYDSTDFRTGTRQTVPLVKIAQRKATKSSPEKETSRTKGRKQLQTQEMKNMMFHVKQMTVIQVKQLMSNEKRVTSVLL